MSVIVKINKYFQGVVSETKKVTWPTKKQVIDYTVVVIVAVGAIMIFFGSIDFGLTKLLEYVVSVL